MKESPAENLVPSGMLTSFTNATQSQYETAVAVGRGVLVGGTGVTVAGTEVAVAGMGVWAGAFCVMAYMVCVTITSTVATESLVAGCWDLIKGMAITVMGKQARIAKAKMPNKIRIELVVSFIVHLHIVQEMDDTLSIKVPGQNRNSTQELTGVRRNNGLYKTSDWVMFWLHGRYIILHAGNLEGQEAM